MPDKKQVGIWIRVSTSFQVQDESPEHHERRARAYVEAKGWEVAEVYRLDAISGKTVIDLAETKRMLKDIQTKRISGLIFSKLARLARNTKELLEFAEIFRANHADLVSLAESIDTSTPAGRLFYTMIAAMAEWERAEIAERVAASVPVRAKMGKPLGGAASFGYRWEGNELVIDENEAPIRKLIYELFLKHRRKSSVADELNSLGYRTRNGSEFTDTTVGRLLRDPTAKGERIANYTKSTGDKKKWVIKPKEEWIIIPCPAVVDAEMWDKCNALLDAQYKPHAKPGPKAVHLLSGFIECHCGNKMYVYHESNNYTCKKCKNRIAAADIDEIYYLQLKSFLGDIDVTDYHDQTEQQLAEKEGLLKITRQEATKLRKTIHELINLRMDGELTKQRFAELNDPLELQLQQLEEHIPELEAEIDFMNIQRLSSDTVLQEAQDLYEQWPEFSFEQKRGIVELITEKIVIESQDITITFAYAPTSFLNSGNSQHNLKGS